jgi:hypothetical protein
MILFYKYQAHTMTATFIRNTLDNFLEDLVNDGFDIHARLAKKRMEIIYDKLDDWLKEWAENTSTDYSKDILTKLCGSLKAAKKETLIDKDDDCDGNTHWYYGMMFVMVLKQRIDEDNIRNAFKRYRKAHPKSK